MRIHIKRKLLDIIQTLADANSAIEKSLGKADASHLCDMLTDCQQGAIHVGEQIEASEGEGTRVVSLLEEYCEEVYRLSLSLHDIGKAKGHIKRLGRLLLDILDGIKNDIKNDKLEIVFLPYSASMWDSLESVWMAADKSENCNAYVIPIPYYEKNPDGSPGRMHYEGNEFPGYVPITSWEEYSIEERKPDIIYIHNPYDNFNKSTTVHPRFYTRELKKHTGMLVYIPYFVSDGNVPVHFCVLPGTMYSDRVIVQTEEQRGTYISELKKVEKENNLSGVFGNLEEKFLVLGSPKFDKVAAATRENAEVPEEWKRLIYKADGSRKKVILYNTTIQALLKHNDAYLDKLEDTLGFFYENRDEITVLWRPHPLIESTISSMRPNLLERYINIVNDYKSKAYGIFDDSGDLHRAIAVSDAYFGDGSSVAALYKATGKPYMIQNMEVRINTL